jgi:uncharacterized membrane protein
MKTSTLDTTLPGAAAANDFTGALALRADHRFYLGMSIAIAVGTFAGFARSYYFRSYFHSSAIHPITRLHGLANTCWILLFVLQNALIFDNRRTIHRRLGWGIGILSLVIVPLTFMTGIVGARLNHLGHAPDKYASFLTFSIRNTLEFAALVGLAIYFRNIPQVHKRFALLAAVSLFGEASIGRIPGLSFALMALIVLAFYFAGPIYDWLSRRRVHWVYLWAIPIMLITGPLTPLTRLAARAGAWHRFVDWLIS